ncbi:AAC-rich mRNA clone AAC11 protein-like [Salvia splendens]|uniref:AAC-rich mRNA clone AAC11 protein-like n=1 Tax=Salvia splendens TaxID=180675 RepID=UPI001C264434|nr:AAC-rich mRNA clone AAC11 protein-like [Salvia splendens]
MEQGEERVEARIDRLEKALLSAIEMSNPPASQEKEKTSGPGEAPPQQYYGPQEGDYQAQVNSIGSWNLDGSWNQGKQRETPWRTHPNFKWYDNDPTQPPPQQNTRDYSHPPERQFNWSGRNQEGQNNWGNQNQGDQSNRGNRNQNNQGNSCVPPHQRSNQGNYQNSQPNYQGNQGPGNQYNNNPGGQGNFRPNQGSGSNHSQGSGNSQLNSKP